MADRVNAFIYWSIYVRASDEGGLRDAHLSHITMALEGVEFDWEIETEEATLVLYRLVTFQNLNVGSIEDIVIRALCRAYRLSNEWSISGLEALASRDLKKIRGQWATDAPANNPSILDSITFEIELGRIRRALPHEATAYGWSTGAWIVINQPA